MRFHTVYKPWGLFKIFLVQMPHLNFKQKCQCWYPKRGIHELNVVFRWIYWFKLTKRSYSKNKASFLIFLSEASPIAEKLWANFLKFSDIQNILSKTSPSFFVVVKTNCLNFYKLSTLFAMVKMDSPNLYTHLHGGELTLRTCTSLLHNLRWSKTDSPNLYKNPTRFAVV